ncbi:conserved hypothetical protein [Candidatus Nitrotoga fabula]|uniref:Uncharacterized protein n=1 Tax=Candidatus Nitrotoga fabula TaxID=2182327 RepID=A0A916BBQ7_9PROT|nr:conserved hypothetical protein [Candidatus Nitrotoga fabula]
MYGQLTGKYFTFAIIEHYSVCKSDLSNSFSFGEDKDPAWLRLS